MKKIHQHLSELPEPHRTNCLKEMNIGMGSELVETQYDAIYLGIDWHNNMDYYEELHDSIVEGRAFNG